LVWQIWFLYIRMGERDERGKESEIAETRRVERKVQTSESIFMMSLA
jgi:hypothetical protein